MFHRDRIHGDRGRVVSPAAFEGVFSRLSAAVGLFCVVFTFAVMTWAGSARAADPDGERAHLYVGYDVAVDVTAADASAARQQALEEGQKRALVQVMRRLTLSSDYDRLPQVGPKTLNRLVRSIDITDERVAATRYRARLNVRFDPQGVRDLLRDARLPFAVAVHPPVLVVPLQDGLDGAALWSDVNPWFRAWQAQANRRGLVPFVTPLGDLGDRAVLDAVAAWRNDRVALSALGARYGVNAVVVSLASLTADPVSGSPAIDASIRDIETADGNVTINGARVQMKATQSAAVADDGADTGDEVAEPSQEVAALSEQAVRALITRVTDAWKQANLLDFGNQGTLTVVAFYDNAADWAALRREVMEVSFIESVSVQAITTGGAEMELRYLGSPAQLASALARRGLVLAKEDNGWTLHRASSQQPMMTASPGR